MKFSFRLLFLALLGLALTNSTFAQNPVKWTFSGKDLGGGMAEITLTGTINEGWFIYSQKLENDMGPIPTSIVFDAGNHYKTKGDAAEGGEKFTEYDKVFEMNLSKFKHTAIFTQKIEVADYSKPITGTIIYMSCNAEMCLPPKEVKFTVNIAQSK